MLRFDDGRPFTVGSSPILFQRVSENESSDKLFIRVLLDDRLKVEAAIDTGGVYLVCSPEVAQLLDLVRDDAMGTQTLNVRGVSIAGDLHRVSLSLLAEHGSDVRIDATALVARLHPNMRWGLPDVILGWQGCMERLRFAVDPVEGTFFFGAT